MQGYKLKTMCFLYYCVLYHCAYMISFFKLINTDFKVINIIINFFIKYYVNYEINYYLFHI